MDFSPGDVVNYTRFNDAADAILQLAREVVGRRTFFVSHTDERTFSILRALNHGATTMVAGTPLTLDVDGGAPVAIPDTAATPGAEGLARRNIRGYYSTPIVLSDGRIFGAFCAVDSVPMELDPDEQSAMQALATLVAFAIELELLVTHDALTGLHNRTLFDDRLKLELARADRRGTYLAVVLLDLDRFTPINETASHAVGDDVLARVGLRLRSTVRRGDTAARIGGDVFGLILPDIRGLDDAARVAETLLESLMDPIRAGGKVFAVTASIGVAVYPLHGADVKELLSSVDAAVRDAKHAGGG